LTSSLFSPVFIAWYQRIKEVTQKLSFNDLLLYNLHIWVVVNRIRYLPADITWAHSETDIQDRYDESVSVATLCYTVRL